MLKVLQDWNDIGQALTRLRDVDLPLHATLEKNWDHHVLLEYLLKADKNIRILDLGCGDGHTLRLFHRLDFRDVYGLDLRVPPILRLRQIWWMYRERTIRPPFRAHVGDLVRTPFEADSFNLISSISTVEHGVDLDSFFREASRLLRNDGLLYITTDYWQNKIQTDQNFRDYGHPWKIFSRLEISELINVAERFGFHLDNGSEIPDCSQAPISWLKLHFTFIALTFRKA